MRAPDCPGSIPMPQAVPSDVATNVIKVLTQATTPMGSTAIAKALPVGGRPKPKALAALLTELVEQGRIVQAGPSTPKFVSAPADAWAQRALLAALSRGPRTESKLKSALPSGFDRLLPAALRSLTEAGKAYRHPPPKKNGKPVFALQPPDAADFLAKDLEKLIAAVASRGFTPAEVRSAARRLLGDAVDRPAAPREDAVLAALRRVDPRTDHGAAVSLPRLREALSAELPSKGDFDAALLALADRGVLELQTHAWPARLNERERELLVENGRGGWFDQVSLRKH